MALLGSDQYVDQIRIIVRAAACPNPEGAEVPSAAELVQRFRALRAD